MKKIVLGLLIGWLGWQISAAEGTWSTVLSSPLAKAKLEKKLVLLDFTGSDWCGWCMKFDKETLSTPEFLEYAKKNLVLVQVDFPRKKEQTEALKKANAAWKAKFQVKGFPTFVVLNGDGKEIGRQRGYAKGGPKAFIAKLEQFKKTQ